MAEEQNEQNEEQSKPKSRHLKTILILAGVLLIEGAVITAVFLLAGGPSDVQADGAVMDSVSELEELVEEKAVAERFQNTKTGKTYLYDTEIYIVIKRMHQERVKKVLKAMSAQLTTDVAIIFRRAEPAHLLEPTLATLQRQIQAVLDERLKRDEEGNPILQDVLIKKCVQFASG